MMLPSDLSKRYRDEPRSGSIRRVQLHLTSRATGLVVLLLAAAMAEGCSHPSTPIGGNGDLPYIPFRAVDGYPDWSPDGITIAYSHWGSGADAASLVQEIWTIDLERMERKPITAGARPDWHPDGTLIIYVLARDIYTVDVTSGETRRLTTSGTSGHARWSSSGAYISFGLGESDLIPRDSVGLWVMNADGSNHEYHRRASSAIWSPNSDTILLLAVGLNEELPHEELAIYDRFSRTLDRLTFNTRVDRDPAWSPDGAQIAWGSYAFKEDEQSGIWVMNSDGTNQRLVVKNGAFPSWSPDGKKIVYTQADCTYTSLWIMNADGSDRRQLTDRDDYN